MGDKTQDDLKEALDRVAELEMILNDIMDAIGVDPDTEYEQLVDEIAYRVR
jgi:hypothetical protein